MTVYGEFDPRFRERPSRLAIGAIFLSLLLGGVSVFATVDAVIDYFLARTAGLATPALDLTLVRRPSLAESSAAAVLDLIPAAIVAPAALLLLSAILLFLFPAERNLSSRIAVICLSLCASIVALRDLLPEVLTLDFDASPAWLSRVVASLIGILLTIASEKRANGLLSALYDLSTPAKRLGMWLVRMLLPMGILLTVAFGSDSSGARAAIVAVTALTFLATLGVKAPAISGEIREAQMREAAAVYPLFALPLFAAHLWLFGVSPLRKERFVWMEEKKPRFASRSGIASFLRTHGVSKAKDMSAPEAAAPPPIKIEWIDNKR